MTLWWHFVYVQEGEVFHRSVGETPRIAPPKLHLKALPTTKQAEAKDNEGFTTRHIIFTCLWPYTNRLIDYLVDARYMHPLV